MVTAKRKVEVFGAGCAMCNEAIEIVKRAACPSREIIIHEMNGVEAGTICSRRCCQ